MKQAGFGRVLYQVAVGAAASSTHESGRRYATATRPKADGMCSVSPIHFKSESPGHRSRDSFLLRYSCSARLLWPRFQPGIYRTHAEPVDLAVTLASLLGINPPAQATGRVLTEALQRRIDRRHVDWGNPMTPIRQSGLARHLRRHRTEEPIIAASGTFGYGIEFEDIVHLDRIGGLVVKGLSKEPMTGNPPPRLYETAAGMLNAIGLQNIGAPAFLTEKLPRCVRRKMSSCSPTSSATPAPITSRRLKSSIRARHCGI